MILHHAFKATQKRFGIEKYKQTQRRELQQRLPRRLCSPRNARSLAWIRLMIWSARCPKHLSAAGASVCRVIGRSRSDLIWTLWISGSDSAARSNDFIMRCVFARSRCIGADCRGALIRKVFPGGNLSRVRKAATGRKSCRMLRSPGLESLKRCSSALRKNLRNHLA